MSNGEPRWWTGYQLNSACPTCGRCPTCGSGSTGWKWEVEGDSRRWRQIVESPEFSEALRRATRKESDNG